MTQKTVYLIFSILLAILLFNVTLVSIKNSVRSMENKVTELKEEIVEEKSKIGLLKTELSYLGRPERIRALANRFLHLRQIQPYQLRSKEQPFAKSPPLRPEEPVDEKTKRNVQWRYKNRPEIYGSHPSAE